MKKAVTLAMVVLVAACSGDSPAVDAARRDRLDAVLSGAVNSGAVPSVVALITTADSVLYRAAFGTLDEGRTIPIGTDAIFRIASMTKPITSVAMMMLVEEGQVRLDDPAADYLPELVGREVLEGFDAATGRIVTRPPSRPPTVRDLLRHTSGFGYAFSSTELRDLLNATELTNRRQPLLHDPGARWTYGMSTAHVGWIVEEVSGMPLLAFFEERIFRPLGMVDTSFDLPASKADRLVASNSWIDGELVGQSRPDSIRNSGRGDGGLLSTADDYGRFMQMILQEGEFRGQRLLTIESLAEMTRDQLGDVTVTEQPAAIPSTAAAFPIGAGVDGFGLGFQIARADVEGQRPPGSLSWAGIQNTHFWIDPVNGLGVVLLMQQYPFYDEPTLNVLVAFEHALYEPAVR